MLLYDMVSKKQIHLSYKSNPLEKFQQKFFNNCYDNHCSTETIVLFIDEYVNKLNNNEINYILSKHCNPKLTSCLINIYFNIFNSVEIIKKQHEKILNMRNEKDIKKDMVSLILYNIVENIQFVF
jgi:hypothetical protein